MDKPGWFFGWIGATGTGLGLMTAQPEFLRAIGVGMASGGALGVILTVTGLGWWRLGLSRRWPFIFKPPSPTVYVAAMSAEAKDGALVGLTLEIMNEEGSRADGVTIRVCASAKDNTASYKRTLQRSLAPGRERIEESVNVRIPLSKLVVRGVVECRGNEVDYCFEARRYGGEGRTFQLNRCDDNDPGGVIQRPRPVTVNIFENVVRKLSRTTDADSTPPDPHTEADDG